VRYALCQLDVADPMSAFLDGDVITMGFDRSLENVRNQHPLHACFVDRSGLLGHLSA